MQPITIQQLIQLTEDYRGKQVEVTISPSYSPNSINSTNTYLQFAIICNSEEETLTLSDYNTKQPQQLIIPISSISKILYTSGKNYFETVFSLQLNNETRIDFCVSEKELVCCKCGKIINLDPHATVWKINGVANYDSKFGNQRFDDLSLCDDCLYFDVFGYKEGYFDE